jgi:hypothetical protein
MNKLVREDVQSLKQKKSNDSKYLLQIVICTYNRTEAAKRAVRSVLPYLNLGVGLVVHSNSGDEEMRNFMADNGLLQYYGEHDSNKGGLENFRSAVKLTDARYFLLLSDEDELRPDRLGRVLEILSGDLDTNYFVLSQIENYFTLRSETELTYSRAQGLTRFSWVLTYMSGFIFPSYVVNDDHFDSYFTDCSYTHLIYKMMMGPEDKLLIPEESYIVKNDDVKHGGHAYEHVTSVNTECSLRVIQNPAVVGYEARVSQFYNLAHLQSRFGLLGVRKLIIIAELAAIWSNAYHQAARLTNDGSNERKKAESMHSVYSARWPSSKLFAFLFKFLCSRLAFTLGISRAYSYVFKAIRRYIYKITWS